MTIVPLKECKSGSGLSPLNPPFMLGISDYCKPIVYLNAFLGLKFFSPSRLAVSMKADPLGNDELSKIKSAGNSFSFYTLQISPTSTLPHFIFISHLPFLKIFVVSCSFNCLSDLYLWKSSYPYLIIEIPITIMSGAHAVNGFKGDITLIDSKIAINKK
jgi:hypothetical protein